MAVRVVTQANSPSSTAVAPVARSVCALLIAIGVPDDDLDEVMAILADEDQFPAESIPRTMTEIAKQARLAHAIYLRQLIHGTESVHPTSPD